MLIAYTEQQQLFIPYQHSRQALQQYRQQQQFFCPQCQQPVQLKIGRLMIPHFAHMANQSCDQRFAEGESKLHLQGKIQLFEWLKTCGHTVELEPFLTKLSQRPDLLLQTEHFPLAIEYQCSPITHETWHVRTEGYKRNNMQVLWLFQTPQNNYPSNAIQKIRIAPILQNAITKTTNKVPYLITYDAQVARFNYWTNLLHVHGHTFIAKVLTIPLHKQQMPFFEPRLITLKAFNTYWQIYKKLCQQYVYQRLLHSKKGVQDPFLRSCYELNLSLNALPHFIGIPVRNAKAIPIFSIEWQAILLNYCRKLQLRPCELDKRNIRLFLTLLNLEATKLRVQAVENYGKLLGHSFQHPNHNMVICEEIYRHLYNQ
ncbi:competence protein CoiA [Lysinibacillus sp. NPDC097195]|uniref:competence protein CoiA n=1 Tax=Lysinibacillus sp. NPDC097195 TaxID=3364141 RepID=UPI0038042AEA